MENGDCWKYFRTKSEAKVGIYNFMIQTPATRPHVVEFSLPRGPLPLTFVKEEPGVIVKQEPIEEEEEMKIVPALETVPECPYICHECNRPFYEAYSLFHHMVS